MTDSTFVKQRMHGQKVQNRHRPPGKDELSTWYRRRRYEYRQLELHDPPGPHEIDCTDPDAPWDPMGYLPGYGYDHRYDNDSDPADRAGLYDELQSYLIESPLRDAMASHKAQSYSSADLVAADAARDSTATRNLASLLPEFESWVRDLEISDNLSRAIADSVGGAHEVAVVRRVTGRQDGWHLGEKILLFSPFWTRSPLTFVGGDAVDLVTHLFARYPVPAWLLPTWKWGIHDRHGSTWLMWFVLLGTGGSLRKAARLFGWHVPRGFTECLFHVPEEVSPLVACMYAEVRRLGGDHLDLGRLAANNAYVFNPIDETGSRGERQARYRTFWRDSVRWLIRHRAQISDEQGNDILDWALHMHTEAARVNEPFSWKGRSLGAVMTRSAAYRELVREKRNAALKATWPAQGWDWQVETPDGVAWSFDELTSGAQLHEEGREMHHCVGVYVGRCLSGVTAIVSMRCRSQRRLTVEVSTRTLRVVQARGARNRPASCEEREVVDLWRQSVLRVGGAPPAL